jgi:mono/diheme cytochrome c family protein
MSIIRISAAIAARGRALPLTLALGVAAIAMGPTSLCAQGASNNAWIAPERAAHRVNPVPATTDAVQHGHDLFRRECEQCHGKAGHGDGPNGISLQPRPADLSSERVQSQSDGAIFWKMTEGRGMMPTAPLSDSEKWAVIAYIRTLATRN